MNSMLIREASSRDMPAIADLRVSAYLDGGFLSAGSAYRQTLRDLGADGIGSVLVAVIPGDNARAGHHRAGAAPATGALAGGDKIVGTVMLQPWPHAGQVVQGPSEAEVRALAVAPEAQHAGIGAALVREIIARAAAAEVGHLVLCSRDDMRAAHRLYERAGFVRLRERDWSPQPGTHLLAYGLRLASAPAPWAEQSARRTSA